MSGSDAEPAGFCKEHQIEEADCPYCRPSIVEDRGQCVEHGVPEALCHRCNPALVAAFKSVGDWCAGHDVPESQCIPCNPNLAARSVASSEPDIPRINRAPDVGCSNDKVAVKLASPETARQAGLEIAKVKKRIVNDLVRCNAEVEYARNRYAQISSRVSGVIHEVTKDLGSRVTAGETLAILDSFEVGSAKAELLRLVAVRETAETKVERAKSLFDRANRIEVRLAAVEFLKSKALLEVRQKDVDREQRLVARKSGSEKALLEARAALAEADAETRANHKKLGLFGIDTNVIAKLDWQDIETLEGRGSTSEQTLLTARIALRTVVAQITAARNRLSTLGLTDEEIEVVIRDQDTSSHLPLIAPFDGVVVELGAVRGEVVDTSKRLFGIADPSKMWAMLDVYPNDLVRVRAGQRVALAVDGLRGESFHGKVTWVSTHVDRRTRTIKVRAELGNPAGLLLAEMFGTATITVHDGNSPVLVVPKDAVQWEGCCNVVFIRHTDTLYETRKVRLGLEDEDFYVAETGLVEGENVVTTGSFLLKTEILKGNIGAGCGCVEGK